MVFSKIATRFCFQHGPTIFRTLYYFNVAKEDPLCLQHKPAGLRGLVAGILAFALLRGVDILPTNHDALTRHIRTQLATSIAHVNMVSHVSNACSSQRAPSLDIDHAN